MNYHRHKCDIAVDCDSCLTTPTVWGIPFSPTYPPSVWCIVFRHVSSGRLCSSFLVSVETGNGSSSFRRNSGLEICRSRSCPPYHQCPCGIETEKMQPTESIQPYFSNSDESLPCCDAEEHFQPREVSKSLVAMGSNSMCVSQMRLQQHHQRRLRSKHLKQLFPEAVIERQTNVLRARLTSTSTVFRSSHEDSTRITELKEKLALAKLEHAKDLLNQSSEYARREAESHQFITSLQEERLRLLQDLQLRSEKTTALQAELDELKIELRDERSKFAHGSHRRCENSVDSAEESAAMLTELRAERLKLMDAVSGAERRLREKDAVVEQLRTERKELKRNLDELFTERRRLKNLLKEIRRDYIHLPGARFVKRILCEIFRICPDFHD
ncbi:unnamed protein product [Calicophoron daubneyi]|uniref:Uncharacterized protein n=1 Tax=Calicophoron daubneyi TaxID=300641 RepID=A0AAV2T0B6_CALDB